MALEGNAQTWLGCTEKLLPQLHPDGIPTQPLFIDTLGKILQKQDFYHVKVTDPLSQMKA